MKHKVIVIQCISSSLNYIDDIRKEGLEPVLMEVNVPPEDKDTVRKILDLEYSHLKGDRPIVISECPDYCQTLQLVKDYAPVLVIPGSDYGIELAAKLSSDLGLPGHNVTRVPFLRRKDKMHEALKDAGIRYIKGLAVSSVEDGIDFYSTELKCGAAIVKPLDGGGSVGVMACHSKDELAEALRLSIASGGEVLVQEMIKGTEYYVNTVSSRGRHVVTNICRYDKIQKGTERPVYVRATPLPPESEEMTALIEYAVNVLDAVGVDIGPSHTEIMVDEKGPVLIEINARLAGAHQPSDWQDSVLGIHESEIALRSYLGKDILETRSGMKAIGTPGGTKAYPLISNGLLHCVYIPHDIDAVDNPIVPLIRSLKSYYGHMRLDAPSFYERTTDLSNIGGIVYLAHPDVSVLEEEYNRLLDLELNHIEELFTPRKSHLTSLSNQLK